MTSRNPDNKTTKKVLGVLVCIMMSAILTLITIIADGVTPLRICILLILACGSVTVLINNSEKE